MTGDIPCSGIDEVAIGLGTPFNKPVGSVPALIPVHKI
jgi:hypothetical protein